RPDRSRHGHRRQPGNRAPAHGGPDQDPARGPRLLPAAQRQPDRRKDPPLLAAVRGACDAAPSRHLARLEARRPLVDPPTGGARAAGRSRRGAGVNVRTVETARGARVRVLEAGAPSGQPLLFLHGLAGLLDQHVFLERLGERYRVLAPELPGYGDSAGEDLLEDMLDFTLHGWDVAAALGVTGQRPH